MFIKGVGRPNRAHSTLSFSYNLGSFPSSVVLYIFAYNQPWAPIFQRLWVRPLCPLFQPPSHIFDRQDIWQQGNETTDARTGRCRKDKSVLDISLDVASHSPTAILYKLKLNQSVTTIPTGSSASATGRPISDPFLSVGFNVETVTYKNVKFNVWDVGGQDKIRPLWRHYYTGTQGLVFVVDSQDRERIDEAKQELHRILSDREMKECLLLVFANKQDLPGGTCHLLSTNSLLILLQPCRPQKLRKSWACTECAIGHGMSTQGMCFQSTLVAQIAYRPFSCATTGEGLFEGLQWLSQNVKKRQQ